MSTSKPTPGGWRVIVSRGAPRVVATHLDTLVCTIHRGMNAYADAELIAEAGSVLCETRRMPRELLAERDELLAQRDELLEAAIDAEAYITGGYEDGRKPPHRAQTILTLTAAIAKTKESK